MRWNMAYIRNGKYGIEEVLSKIVPKVTGKNTKVDFDGDLIKMGSQRYRLFKEKGIKCVSCGIEGRFFAKERTHDIDTYHFNLYAIDENGEEVLMTKDHIIPKSLGGKNKLSNYQTMCFRCNIEKGNIYEVESR